jgi:hypothetical protein
VAEMAEIEGINLLPEPISAVIAFDSLSIEIKHH